MRAGMAAAGVDALLLSLGADLPWLTGYEAMPLERLTMLVLPAAGDPVLVVPLLEEPRVPPSTRDLVEVRAWSEEEDPVGLVLASLPPGSQVLGVSDRTWAVALLALQERRPGARWTPASAVTAPVRAVKDAAEIAALEAAAAAADRVADDLQSGAIPLAGRTERQVAGDVGRRLVEEGHQRVNFAIVASGPNAASPHHEPTERVIAPGDTVVCDFGGALVPGGGAAYCSDITRTLAVGEPPDDVRACYDVLAAAQAAGRGAARAGVAAWQVDDAARRVIEAAGFGRHFVHRTGHGIGVEEHEPPYLVAGNEEVLVPGNAFSVEPGIYLPGRFGMRLEDIVVIGPGGESRSLNRADRSLVVVDP
ncbi:MAG: aminopeptidase P family protein [Actinomycetota bacterium]|nr:aminopeptidase P family protein [Actinomycetota bacterium]